MAHWCAHFGKRFGKKRGLLLKQRTPGIRKSGVGPHFASSLLKTLKFYSSIDTIRLLTKFFTLILLVNEFVPT